MRKSFDPIEPPTQIKRLIETGDSQSQIGNTMHPNQRLSITRTQAEIKSFGHCTGRLWEWSPSSTTVLTRTQSENYWYRPHAPGEYSHGLQATSQLAIPSFANLYALEGFTRARTRQIITYDCGEACIAPARFTEEFMFRRGRRL